MILLSWPIILTVIKKSIRYTVSITSQFPAILAGSFHYILLIHKIAAFISIGRFAQKHNYGKKEKTCTFIKVDK